MSEHIVSANGAALPNRRSFLTTGAVAVASVAVPVAAMATTQDNQDDLAISLWEKRSTMKPLFIAAIRAQREAEARLPWWAKSGPNMLCHDGTFTGQVVGWPAIQDLERPDRPGVYHLIRPGKFDAWRFNGMSGEWRERAIRKARDDLAKRMKAQRAEKWRAGVITADWALEALYDQLDAIDDQIDKLSNSTPNAAAVLVLHTTLLYVDQNYGLNMNPELHVALKAFEFLRPHLRGIVKEHVEDLLDNPDQPVKWCKAYLYDDREDGTGSISQTA